MIQLHKQLRAVLLAGLLVAPVAFAAGCQSDDDDKGGTHLDIGDDGATLDIDD